MDPIGKKLAITPLPEQHVVVQDEAPPPEDAFAGKSRSNATAKKGVERLKKKREPGNALVDARMKATLLAKLEPRLVDTAQVFVEDREHRAIAGVNAKGRVMRFEGVKSMLDASALMTLDVELGKLTREQFDAVHAEFGGRSRVAFDAAHEYRAIDFFPPLLQTLIGKDLDIPDAITLRGTKKLTSEINMDPSDLSIGLTMNCHASAWEAARAFQGPCDDVSIFYGEMITMDGLVSGSPDNFQKIGEVAADKLSELEKLDLRPGDIVQFFEIADWQRMTMLLHSAVYAGGGLYFDKPNTEGAEVADKEKYIDQEETPYRSGTIDMIAKPIGIYVENKFRVEVYRPKLAMPEAEKAFESSLETGVRDWAAKKGRALGVDLVAELEQGMGGNIRGEHASALVKVPLSDIG